MSEGERKLFSNKELKNLIIPLFLEQLLTILVGLADTFVISFVSEAAVSGVSLVNSFNTIFIFLFTALASGGAVITSQYIGRQCIDRQYIGRQSIGGKKMAEAGGGGKPTADGFHNIFRKYRYPAFAVWKADFRTDIRAGGRGCDGGVCDIPSDFGIFLSGACGL